MNLEVLPNIPDNMKFVCLSFLTSKNTDAPTSVTGIRFGGAFSTYEEACTHAENIRQIDSYHHVYVGDSGKWLPFDPNPNSTDQVKESDYANKNLDELMKGHKESQDKAKIFHELRKNEKMVDNINDNLKNQQTNKADLQLQLNDIKDEDEMTSLVNSIDNIDDQIKNMELKLEEYTKTTNELKKQVDIPLVN